MVEIVYGNQFKKFAQNLPKLQKEKLALLLLILNENPFDQRLHSKSLRGPLEGFFSFRITRDWRVIFVFEELPRLIAIVQLLFLIESPRKQRRLEV